MGNRSSGGSRGGSGVGTPLFWPINAFEWGHIVGTPLYPGLGTPLFKMAGSTPEKEEQIISYQYRDYSSLLSLLMNFTIPISLFIINSYFECFYKYLPFKETKTLLNYIVGYKKSSNRTFEIINIKFQHITVNIKTW